MIELDEHGNIPPVTQARVYVVAGFTDGRPFSGLNHWSDAGHLSQADIEAYDTFQGWACDTLSTTDRVDNQERPTSPAHVRVALFEDTYVPGRRYTALDVGPARASEDLNLDQQPGFLGWISPTFKAQLVPPVPRLLMRHRVNVAGATVEALFIATRTQLDAAWGRSVLLGPFPGRQEPEPVTLAPAQFHQLSDNQRVLEEMQRFARPDGAISGFNPLSAPEAPVPGTV